MKQEKLAAVFFAAVTVLALAATAGAVDGTIEINQAKVLAAGGFPYTVAASGSYRLTGNLTAPAGTSGINVTASDVTIDLNGFTILGSGGSSDGINALGKKDVTVENGTVTGFGVVGVQGGNFSIVRKVHADANPSGIEVGSNSVVEGCTASNSTNALGFGIECDDGCTISGNTVNANAGNGIECGGNGCVISGNTANLNTPIGIDCGGSGCLISGNIANLNTQTGLECIGSGCAFSGNSANLNKESGIQCGGTGCLISGNTLVGNVTGISAAGATTGFGGNVLQNTTNFLGGTSMNNNVCTTGSTTSAC